MKAVTVAEVVDAVSSLLQMWERSLDRGQAAQSEN
jgi:hypothetical protein